MNGILVSTVLYKLKFLQCYVRALVFWMMGVAFSWNTVVLLNGNIFPVYYSVEKHSKLWIVLFHFCWIMLIHSFTWSRPSCAILHLGSTQVEVGNGRTQPLFSFLPRIIYDNYTFWLLYGITQNLLNPLSFLYSKCMQCL